MNEFRPSSLSDFVGQKNVIECLKILVEASKIDQNKFPHILLEGPPGLGKTSLAYAIAKELNVDIQIANGGATKTIKCLLPYLMKVNDNSILFIDEIHRLGNLSSEFLYPAMEDFRVDVGKDNDTVTINLPQFVLIGATTDSGLLTAPLRNRFGQKFQLQEYSTDELALLIEKNSVKIGATIDMASSIEISKRSRGIPRLANHLLEWVHRYNISFGRRQITKNVVVHAMILIGVDEDGLDSNDRKYLQILQNFNNQPVGLQTLSSMTDICEETIVQSIEPFLLRQGLIRKTQKGRMLV